MKIYAVHAFQVQVSNPSRFLLQIGLYPWYVASVIIDIVMFKWQV